MQIPATLERVADRVLSLGPVVTARAVFTSFGEAGGGLLAGGLAYAALFALLPGLLLVVGVLGFFVDDPERRAAIVAQIGRTIPPLEEFARLSLEQARSGAVPSSIVGIAGLAWGSSRFYASLDDAFARIFRSAPERGLVRRMIRGLLSILLVVSVFVFALILTGVASLVAEQAPFGLPIGDATRAFWRFAGPASAILVFVVGVAAIYRLVPARHVPWSVLAPPALTVGVALGLFTQLFSLLAPRLIGAAALFGSFVAVFALLVWLSFSFQLLLIGAAWARHRLVRDVVDGGAGTPTREGEEPARA